MKLDKKIERTLNAARRSFFGAVNIYISGRGKIVFEVGKLRLNGRISEKMLYMYINDYTMKMRVKDFTDPTFVLSVVRAINDNGKETDEIFSERTEFNINKFFDNLNDFNNENSFRFISRFISKDDEFIRTFKKDFEYKSRIPIFSDYIVIEENDLKIYFPMSYLINDYTKEDSIIVEFVTRASNINNSDKRIKKILKWLKKYKESYPV